MYIYIMCFIDFVKIVTVRPWKFETGMIYKLGFKITIIP